MTTSWTVTWMEGEVLSCTTHLPNSPWNIHEIQEWNSPTLMIIPSHIPCIASREKVIPGVLSHTMLVVLHSALVYERRGIVGIEISVVVHSRMHPSTITDPQIRPRSLKSAFHTAAAAPVTTRLFPAYSRTSGGVNTRIQLPDVTGITSAVATPLKGDASSRRVPDPKPSSTFASRLYRQPRPMASTSNHPTTSKPTAPASRPMESAPAANLAILLDTLTHRLHQIERESLTSRRRVNEWERGVGYVYLSSSRGLAVAIGQV
jgi:hypothetical protein